MIMTIINKNYLIPDKYGNTSLSLAIEEGNIQKVRQMYSPPNYTDSDIELLKRIAIDMMNHNIQEQYGLSWDIFSRIYSEAKYQLDLQGEDTTDVIDVYNNNLNIKMKK